MDDYDVNGDNATDFQDGEPIRDLKGRTEIANFKLRTCLEWQDREVSVP